MLHGRQTEDIDAVGLRTPVPPAKRTSKPSRGSEQVSREIGPKARDCFPAAHGSGRSRCRGPERQAGYGRRAAGSVLPRQAGQPRDGVAVAYRAGLARRWNVARPGPSSMCVTCGGRAKGLLMSILYRLWT